MRELPLFITTILVLHGLPIGQASPFSAMAARREKEGNEEEGWKIARRVASLFSLPNLSHTDFRSSFLIPLGASLGLKSNWKDIFKGEEEWKRRQSLGKEIDHITYVVSYVLDKMRESCKKAEGVFPRCQMVNAVNFFALQHYPEVVGGPIYRGNLIPSDIWRDVAARDLDQHMHMGGEAAFFVEKVWPIGYRDGKKVSDSLTTENGEIFEIWHGTIGYYLRPEREQDEVKKLQHVTMRRGKEHSTQYKGRRPPSPIDSEPSDDHNYARSEGVGMDCRSNIKDKEKDIPDDDGDTDSSTSDLGDDTEVDVELRRVANSNKENGGRVPPRVQK